MTAPGGTPGLPTGTVLTLANLESRLQDATAAAMRGRALDWFPNLAGSTTGLNPALSWTPFGILTDIWSRFNHLIATANPNDIKSAADLDNLIIEFVTGLPLVAQFVDLTKAFLGTYTGTDPTLTTIQNLFGTIPKLLGGLLSGSMIPGLDASKIVSGSFLTSLIPNLDASKIVSGSFLTSLIPSLDVSKITSGIFGAGFIPGLDASKITSGVFGTGLIPGLDISQITTGLLSGGTILTSLIPGLPASQITSGTFGGGLIPGLDVSKIISGTFGLGFIPSLPASQIGSGVFGAGLIPALDVSKITTGIFGSGFIPGLDASKITSGTFADGLVPTLGSLRDAIAQAINGGATTGYTAAQVKTALGAIPGGNIASALLASVIPALDASKITSGAFGAGLIPALDVSKITTGVFGTGFIPALPASQISSGVFGAGLIPALDASKITTGVFPQSMLSITSIAAGIVSGALAVANIPDLDASKITSGAFGATQIPLLDASKIATGIFGTGLIPNLDASKITSGVFANAVTGVDSVWNTIATALGGSGSTQTAANAQLTNINGRVTVLEGKGILTQYTTSSTWTKPTVGADAVAFTANELFTIICINGGGGGLRAGNSNNCQVKGGISGGYVSKQVKYSALAASYAMTIGTGAAGATAEAAPALGGSTSFGALVVGAAGVGAVYRDDGTYAVSVPPGNGGAGCWRATGFPPEFGQSGPFAAGGTPGVGAAGGNGAAAPSNIPSGGAGGGGGGATAGGGFAGGAGGFPGGAGGGGGALTGTSNGAGGAGAAGCIFVIAPH